MASAIGNKSDNLLGNPSSSPQAGQLTGKKVSVWSQIKNFCHENRKAIGIALLIIGASLAILGCAFLTMGLSLLPMITLSGHAVFAITSLTQFFSGAACFAASIGPIAGGVLLVMPR